MTDPGHRPEADALILEIASLILNDDALEGRPWDGLTLVATFSEGRR